MRLQQDKKLPLTSTHNAPSHLYDIALTSRGERKLSGYPAPDCLEMQMRRFVEKKFGVALHTDIMVPASEEFVGKVGVTLYVAAPQNIMRALSKKFGKLFKTITHEAQLVADETFPATPKIKRSARPYKWK